MSIDQTGHVKIMSSKTQPSNAKIKLIHETDQSNFPFDLNFKASIINTHRGILLERLEEAESKYLCRVNTLDMATDHVDEVQADLDKARAYTCRLYDRLRKTVHRERVKHNRIKELEEELENTDLARQCLLYDREKLETLLKEALDRAEKAEAKFKDADFAFFYNSWQRIWQRAESRIAELEAKLETSEQANANLSAALLEVGENIETAKSAYSDLLVNSMNEIGTLRGRLEMKKSKLKKTEKLKQDYFEQCGVLRDIINRAKVDPNSDQANESVIDNSYTGQIAQQSRTIRIAQNLLRIADCPNCDGTGSCGIEGVGLLPCQWCEEKQAILSQDD